MKLDAGQRAMQTKHHRQRIALGVALLVLVPITIFRLLGKAPQDASAMPASQNLQEPRQSQTNQSLLPSWQPVPVTWPIELRRDFFVSNKPIVEIKTMTKISSSQSTLAVVRRDAAEQLSVEAIMGGKKVQALINGTLVVEGDTIAGFYVRRIRNRRILVERDGFQVVIEP